MKRLLALAALAALSVPAMAGDDWWPSKHGAGDTLGAANNLSPEATKAAAQLVKLGKTYALGVVTDRTTPAYPPRTYNIVVTQSNDGMGVPMAGNRVTANDDILMTYLGIGTQLDGLGHVGIGHRYYNGMEAKDFVSPGGLTKLGTENIPPMATRGILLDMTKLKGVKMLAAGTAINRKEIDAAAKAAGVTIGKGDVVLFNTGYLALAAKAPAQCIAEHPWLGKEGAAYLASLGVVAVGADTAALEVIPFEDKTEAFPVHQILLARNGVHILENINTAELARDGATAFLFVLGQPRFQGAVQMVVNPIAIR
ncbi:MAG: cyclase family protein [Alphaproteobacteria bacterium]